MMRCHWRTMPWPPLLMMIVFTGSWLSWQVARSWLFIWTEPSPSMFTTRRRGWPARGAPHARVLEAVVLGGPHLVLAHPRHHEGLALGEIGELLDHVLGLDDV